MTQENIQKRRYLGDGLYAWFDGYHVVLAAGNGAVDANTVYLDPATLAAFGKFVAELKQANSEVSDES